MRYLVVKKEPSFWVHAVSPFYFYSWTEAARWMLANGLRAMCVIKEVA